MNISPENIYKEAAEAAVIATNEYLKKHPDQWYPCGFAWVKIKPARGQFVSYLKSKNIGRLSYEGGYDIWNPSGNMTQWMDAKYEGAKAFAAVLNKYGIKATEYSRVD